MVYATYGKGSKSGGFVSQHLRHDQRDLRLQAGEIRRTTKPGSSPRLSDGSVVLNVSVYDTKFDNLQVSVYNPTNSTYVTGNAASASSKGVEGSAAWYPMKNLDFTGVGRLPGRQVRQLSRRRLPRLPAGRVCNPAVPASFVGEQPRRRRRLPYTSKFSFTIQGHYRWMLAERSPTLDGIDRRRRPLEVLRLRQPEPAVRHAEGLRQARRARPVRAVGRPLARRAGRQEPDQEKTTGSAFNLPAPITPVPRAILYLEETRNVAIEAGARF